jgi:hypothetical protein
MSSRGEQSQAQIEVESSWATCQPRPLDRFPLSPIPHASRCYHMEMEKPCPRSGCEWGHAGQLSRHYLKTVDLSSQFLRPTSESQLTLFGGAPSVSQVMTQAQQVDGHSMRCNGQGQISTGTCQRRRRSLVTDPSRLERGTNNPARLPTGSCSIDLTTDMTRSCMNCGNTHPQASGRWSSDCLMIYVHTRGEVQRAQLSPQISIMMPQSPSDRAAIGAKSWAAFEVVKAKNASEREFAIRMKQGRPLRDVAPLPWLRWKAKEGRSGQFRSKQNFDAWWTRYVQGSGESAGIEMAWLTVQL